jgi:cytoskeletal protein CcmA (bactofilin family)
MARTKQLDPLNVEMQGLIGEGTTLSGELAFQGAYRVDGRITGRVSCSSTLVVGPPGRLEIEELRAASLVVSGSVEGTIEVQDRLEVADGGRVRGRVTLGSPGLVLARGASFEGTIVMRSADSDGKS